MIKKRKIPLNQIDIQLIIEKELKVNEKQLKKMWRDFIVFGCAKFHVKK